MKSHLFYLDWNIHRLFGYENYKSDKVIDSIIRGIEAGDDFPAVQIHQDVGIKNKFYISPIIIHPDMFADGGHFRALGHYIANKPLKCELLSKPFPRIKESLIEIYNIIIVDDFHDYDWHKERFPNYR